MSGLYSGVEYRLSGQDITNGHTPGSLKLKSFASERLIFSHTSATLNVSP